MIFDTGVERALRAGSYAARRAECERALEGARVALRRPLASLSELAPSDLGRLERAIDGVAFRRARHVVTENARVRALAQAFESGELARGGEAMFASHESLRVDYQVTAPESDALVEEARALPGCIGARMTGAGFGGCNVNLVDAQHATRVRGGARAPLPRALRPGAALLVLSRRGRRESDMRRA